MEMEIIEKQMSLELTKQSVSAKEELKSNSKGTMKQEEGISQMKSTGKKIYKQRINEHHSKCQKKCCESLKKLWDVEQARNKLLGS